MMTSHRRQYDVILCPVPAEIPLLFSFSVKLCRIEIQAHFVLFFFCLFILLSCPISHIKRLCQSLLGNQSSYNLLTWYTYEQ